MRLKCNKRKHTEIKWDYINIYLCTIIVEQPTFNTMQHTYTDIFRLFLWNKMGHSSCIPMPSCYFDGISDESVCGMHLQCIDTQLFKVFSIVQATHYRRVP